MIDIKKIDFDKMNGLVPAIIIDENEKVLMLGFMNQESLKKTIELSLVTFFSRSKNRMWTKGETSGNFLNVLDIKLDCDNDSILIKVEPKGPVCHTGNYSCFDIDVEEKFSFNYLYDIIKRRKIEMPENSYSTKLFNSGINRIAQKVGEEAIETVIASMNNNKEEAIYEISDLFFHLMVLMNQMDISLADINNELEKRHKK
ncbi:MAG: bifunctional phosphoribosyl-AMP cyclohydrolase/phosphoribosyl-ATP diphosphatase HisIE [Ignavibacteriaceae bacterium]|jgi:phosphoribosyl-ATP pyrophosphohydrolase/phosphoribosyl-AMP cyclohydrolase|nr:bifunctional phosphoribosyl-AMP cyclohydrolase/phosphoribosyl-ATP diphosphatase HisIE [Ignavibacteriaceae bacterium]